MLDKILGLFSQAGNLASEAIEDKDKRNELNAVLEQLKQQVYITELKTQTIPWVDALHKMGRQIISLTTIIMVGIVVSLNPDIEIWKILSGAGPGAVYTLLKGTGQ